MQLCIKQRAISWTDTFDVYAKGGKVKYFVTAEFLSLFHRLRVYDKKKEKAADQAVSQETDIQLKLMKYFS